MRATDWEFKNRGLIFGYLIFAAFLFYTVDRQIAVTPFADWLHASWHWTATDAARLSLALGSIPILCAALLRTWASAYLQASVVYASAIRSDTLVAGGPYRYVRNPLYLGNVLMSLSLGAMASRLGFWFLLLTFVLFCYRLIFREEAELAAAQDARYRSYAARVPRLFPSFFPRVPAAQQTANWQAAVRNELWFYGFPLGVLGFALTLNIGAFFVPVGLFAILSRFVFHSHSAAERT